MMRSFSAALAAVLAAALWQTAAFGVGYSPGAEPGPGPETAGGGSEASLAGSSAIAAAAAGFRSSLTSPSEIAAAATAGARGIGSSSPMGRRLRDARGDLLGPGGFCFDCPMDEELASLLPPLQGIEGLGAADLQPLYDIPIFLNERVESYISYFTGRGRGHFQRYLNRGARWIPLMHEILDGYDLPRDLIYVAMIESGFSMSAYSHAHASGPWQFIAPTAEIYDLRMDPWVDERRDPIKATHAAARYLIWLYREFEDWPLAWAGYNGGPTRVRRNMNRTGLEDYWDLCEAGRLPRETCGYVPKIMAAAIISKHPERFGFEISPLPPFDHEIVEVEAPTDLAAIAGLLGVDLDDLRSLNPELRRPMTPPPPRGESGYQLRLPPGKTETFLAGKDELEPSRFVAHESYRVRPGDSLWRIARAHDTTVSALSSANPGLDPQRLMPGAEVMVPLPPGTRPRVPASREPKQQPSAEVVARGGGRVEVRHSVAAGDTLWSIAQRHGVTTEQLIAWNGLASRGDHVHLTVGQRLVVGHGRGAPSAVEGDRPVHVLQAGETLWQLSQRYGKSVDDLRALNGIDDVHSLSVGQVIVVGR